jgi:hypothetical protein
MEDSPAIFYPLSSIFNFWLVSPCQIEKDFERYE